MTALSSAIQSFIDEVRTPEDEPIAFYDNADSVSSASSGEESTISRRKTLVSKKDLSREAAGAGVTFR